MTKEVPRQIDSQDNSKSTSEEPGTGINHLVAIPLPAVSTEPRIDRVFPGQPIPPLVRVRTFSPDDWEEFIREWAHSLKQTYHTVARCGGSGDMGRDIVAYTGKPSAIAPWDNYQCKHYDHPLRPGDIWLELGKLVYHTFHGHFSVPREYFFVCPHDVGTSLSRLLENPEKLRHGLVENWNVYCRGRLTSTNVSLTGRLKQYVTTFSFDIISFIPVLKILEQHRTTPWYVHRFGGGLPNRPKREEPPEAIATHEVKYVSELFKAYSDNQGTNIDQPALSALPKLNKHFLLSRASFYSAEALKAFSRDHLPENEYGRLQDEIYDGIQETYLDEYEDGYRKIIEVTKAAVTVQITDHPLLPVLQPPDRRGICHQLVDMDKLQWVDTDE